MKRVFTKVLTGTEVAVIGPPGGIISNNVASWLLQEAIEVLGVAIAVANEVPSENDGYANVAVEVSQSAMFNQDGALLEARAGEGWNTTPAGICRQNGHQVAMFPEGYAVPIREEGSVYINTLATGKTAGDSSFNWTVNIFYVKKSSK